MPYTNGFIKVNFSGSAFEDLEIWNTGFNIITSPTVNIDTTVLQNVLDIVKPSFATFFARSGQSAFKNTHFLERVKCSHIGLDGKVVKNNVVEEYYEPPIRGVSSQQIGPGQIAIVVTLRSAIRKGPAALGRMYLPLNHGEVGADGLFYNNYMTELRTATRNLFNNINGALPSGMLIGLTSPIGTGVQSSVISIKVDNKPDTQRRRVNYLPSGGDFLPLATP